MQETAKNIMRHKGRVELQRTRKRQRCTITALAPGSGVVKTQPCPKKEKL
jgi:hypothetical protein